jgi:hypothetical protein
LERILAARIDSASVAGQSVLSGNGEIVPSKPPPVKLLDFAEAERYRKNFQNCAVLAV